MTERPLADQVALVTGASGGIGRAIAIRLAQMGARVGIHYNLHPEGAAKTLELAGGQGFTVAADFSRPDDVLQCAAEVKIRLGGRPLDVLVNNAGAVSYSEFPDIGPEELERLWRINARAPFFLTQSLLPEIPRGGRIINISSIAARIAFAEVMEYSMAKAALESFTRTLAVYLGPRGITVNAVAPGEILTEMSSWLHDPAAQEMVLERQALKTIGTPEEVADVVAFLAGPDSGWMTGQVLSVCGGYGR